MTSPPLKLYISRSLCLNSHTLVVHEWASSSVVCQRTTLSQKTFDLQFLPTLRTAAEDAAFALNSDADDEFVQGDVLPPLELVQVANPVRRHFFRTWSGPTPFLNGSTKRLLICFIFCLGYFYPSHGAFFGVLPLDDPGPPEPCCRLG